VTPGKGDLMTRASFADFRLHVEFRTPLEPDRAAGQARGNSGVYLQRRNAAAPCTASAPRT
jgi:hypothetical protein